MWPTQIERLKNQNRASDNIAGYKISPVAAVQRSVPVIAHDKVFAFRDHQLTIANILFQHFLRWGIKTNIWRPWKIIAISVVISTLMLYVRLRDQFAVTVQLLIVDAQMIAGN